MALGHVQTMGHGMLSALLGSLGCFTDTISTRHSTIWQRKVTLLYQCQQLLAESVHRKADLCAETGQRAKAQ